MTAPTTNPNRYSVGDPPTGEDVRELTSYIVRELHKLEALLELLTNGQIERTYAAPNKLVDGMLRYADGATWNPGAGRGIYRYDSTTPGWVFLG